MNKTIYKERYGVEPLDPCSHDGLLAPVNTTGGYSHTPTVAYIDSDEALRFIGIGVGTFLVTAGAAVVGITKLVRKK